jgi:hypothetical protein
VQQEDNERHREWFALSTTFLKEFGNRNGFSFKTWHYERRSARDQTNVNYFLGWLKLFPYDDPPELVFTMDETCWRLFEAPRRVVAEKCLDAEKLQFTNGEQKFFTTLGAISCAGEKLLFRVLCKRPDGSM